MTNEPTYWNKSSYLIMAGQLEDLLGKEKQVQAITEAWNSGLPVSKAIRQEWIRRGWPELADAIKDALTEEADDDPHS